MAHTTVWPKDGEMLTLVLASYPGQGLRPEKFCVIDHPSGCRIHGHVLRLGPAADAVTVRVTRVYGGTTFIWEEAGMGLQNDCGLETDKTIMGLTKSGPNDRELLPRQVPVNLCPDGTIEFSRAPHMVLGMGVAKRPYVSPPKGEMLILVPRGDRRMLVFTPVNEQWPQEKDPFFDPPEPQAVGTADVYLSSLSYLIEIEDDFTVVDHAGNELGNCAVEIWPLTASGAELDEDADMVDEPSELIGKSFKFKVRIKQVRGLPPKFKKDVHCRFKWYLEETVTETAHKDGQSPTLDFEKIYTVECVTKEFLDNFLNGSLQVEVWATQDAAAKSAMPGRVKSGDSAKVSKVKELIAAAKGAGAKVIDIADLEAALGN